MAETKTKIQEDSSKKTNWKVRLIALTVITIMIFAIVTMLMDPRPKDKEDTRNVTSQVISPQIFTVAIGEKPVEIKGRMGMRTCFQPETENVWWWVRIDHDPEKTYHRPPVNSPEYKNKSYGDSTSYVEVWLDPGNVGKLEYYFKPL